MRIEQFSDLFYVNPPTSELCRWRLDGSRRSALEALKSQGVTQWGQWRLSDLHNWGKVAMRTWEFRSISEPCKEIAEWFGLDTESE